MTNLQKNKDYPANKALRHFFDDLTQSKISSMPEEGAQSVSKIDEQLVAKISQAQRLLAKAGTINDLLLDAVLEPRDDNAEQLESKSSKIVPVDKVNNLEQQNNGATENENKENIEIAETYSKGQTRSLTISLKDSLSNRFQVLLFKVANLTIAIPLVELGGIHQISKITKLAKQPNWCKGIMVKGTEKFTCVDASYWLIPHKYASGNDAPNECEFGVQLGKTPFLLCCNSISETVELSKGDVKWRESTSTRPWLAGLLKKEMCALIDGAQMVQDVLK
jgi:purine-binding chemotaxis protein CheW